MPKYLTLLLFLTIFITVKTEKLRWALELFTSGAHSPTGSLSKNNMDDFGHQWDGPNELTGVGLRQHFLVGYRNRLRYIDEKKLINEKYDPREVYLVSMDTNSTIMSANAQVQGLFLPGTGPLLFENQSAIALPPVNPESYKNEKEILDKDSYMSLPHKMNIMPIHSFYPKDHFIGLQDKNICKTLSETYEKNEKRDEVKNYLAEMTKKYGKQLKDSYYKNKDEDMLNNYTFAMNFFDNIISLYYYGADELDDIINKLNSTIENLTEDAYKFLNLTLVGNGINNDKDIVMNSMSPVFNQLLLWLNAKIEKDINGEEDYKGYELPTFVMYSVDDSTCATFMRYMKELFGAKINYPKFASNLYLELVRKDIAEGTKITKNDYRIDYFFNDDYILSILYNDFEKNIKSNLKTKEDIDKFCGFAIINKTNGNLYVIIDIVWGIVAVSLIVLIFVVITIKKKQADNINFNEKDGPLIGETL